MHLPHLRVSAFNVLSTAIPATRISHALNAVPIHFQWVGSVWGVLRVAALVQISILVLFAAMAITDSQRQSVNLAQLVAGLAPLLVSFLARAVWMATSSIPAIFAFPVCRLVLLAILAAVFPVFLDFFSREVLAFLARIIVSPVSMPLPAVCARVVQY